MPKAGYDFSTEAWRIDRNACPSACRRPVTTALRNP